MRTLLAILIYIPLQIFWLPLSILGVSWVSYKQIYRSKKLGLSQTAIEIVNGRWTGHVFGLRKDQPSRKIAGKLPNNSTFGLRLALFPLMIAKIINGKPIFYPALPEDEKSGIANMVFSRSRRFDELLEGQADSAEQFVILGAGLDTRAYGPLKERNLKIFELDLADNQKSKRKALKRARLKADHVQFIEVNFEEADWINNLLASAYDPAKKTMFLWEGVTLYLSESDVLKTLALIKANAAAGSAIMLDIYGGRMLELARKGPMAKTLEATGEEIGFGLDFEGNGEAALQAFTDKTELDLGAHYFMGASHKKGAYMVVAELLV